MSFEGAWGFDPDKALRAQAQFQLALVHVREETPERQIRPEDLRIPASRNAQVYELRRLFRL